MAKWTSLLGIGGLMKNKCMDVEQLLPHKHLWDRHQSRSFSRGRVASFSPRAASSKSRCGGTSLLKDSLHVWQRQSAHVSNNIKQTSCILGLLLISPRIAPSPSWPWLRLLWAPLLKRMKTRGSAETQIFFTGFLIGSSTSVTKIHIQPDSN